MHCSKDFRNDLTKHHVWRPTHLLSVDRHFSCFFTSVTSEKRSAKECSCSLRVYRFFFFVFFFFLFYWVKTFSLDQLYRWVSTNAWQVEKVESG